MKNTIQDLGIEVYLSYEDPRYPVLVIRGQNGGSVGYNLRPESGELERVCICHARSWSECACGAWDDFEKDEE